MSDHIDDYGRRWDAEGLVARETAANDLPLVKLVTTKGEITAELFRNELPVTTANFLRLVGENAYDGQRIGFADDSVKRHFGFRVGANTTDVRQKEFRCPRDIHSSPRTVPWLLVHARLRPRCERNSLHDRIRPDS